MAHLLWKSFSEAAERVRFRRQLPRNLPARTVQVAEHFATMNLVWPGFRLSLGDLRTRFSHLPARTLQRDLATLCEAGILEASGTKKGTRYRIAESVDPVDALEAQLKEAEARERKRGS